MAKRDKRDKKVKKPVKNKTTVEKQVNENTTKKVESREDNR